VFLDYPVLIVPSERYGNPKGQSRQDNPETLVILGTQDTGQTNVRVNRRGNQDRTIVLCPVYPILLFLDCPVLIAPSVYSNVCLSCVLCAQYYQCFLIVMSSRQENPETIVLSTQDTGHINARANRRGNKDRIIQKHW
jgi:hypothetical protein